MMKRINFTVPIPVRLNCWKHHAGYIRMRINGLNTENEFIHVIREMLSIGSSQMDLYTGRLSPAEISYFILGELHKKNIDSFRLYSEWIHKDGKDFQLIEMHDKSGWALRMGNEEERFVHIHPGRYSENSVRVKAAALKTAAAVLMWQKIKNLPEVDLSLINYVRKNFISAPPIKEIQDRGLMKVIALLKHDKPTSG